MNWIVENVIRPRWIVNEYGEMGIRIFGVNCYYYKWDSPLIYGEDEPSWRYIYKREFGECVISKFVKPPMETE